MNNDYLKVPTTTQTPRQPVVRFEYPDSENTKMKVRYVRVAEANGDYIKGEEIDGPLSQKKGVFKTFSLTRIVQNGVALVSF